MSGSGTYNAAVALLEANVMRSPERTAFISGDDRYSFGEIGRRADEFGLGYLRQGLRQGDRIALCLPDSVDLVCAFLGAIKAGVLPIPLNTLWTASDYAHVLRDSGASAALVAPHFLEIWSKAAAEANWSGATWVGKPPMVGKSEGLEIHPALPDDSAFLLYSSGSTGRPKGVLHRHASLAATADSFGKAILGLHPEDVVFSAAKLFFAYGLGNSLTFPLSVGAAAVLHGERVTADAVWRILREQRVTVFCGVPTLYASLMASPDFPRRDDIRLRLCVSAGEPLPADIGRRWTERTGVEIIDGIGSTEMLHIFISNQPGAVRYGSTGRPAPGYEAQLRNEDGSITKQGELGDLFIRGPSAARGYWNDPVKTAMTFVDGWVRTGDKFRQEENGEYIYAGRSDDMLKVSGLWVSPTEIESTLIEHAAVQEVAVIGAVDQNGLIKTKAFVVLAANSQPSNSLIEELQAFVKARVAPHKYPRTIEFVEELPKTATGKIRRHALREQEAANSLSGA